MLMVLSCRRRDIGMAQRTQETSLRFTWVEAGNIFSWCQVLSCSGRRGWDAAETTNSLHQHSTFRIRKRISFQQVPVQVSSPAENKDFIQIFIWNILIVSFQTPENRDSGGFGSDRASSQGKYREGWLLLVQGGRRKCLSCCISPGFLSQT